MGKSKGKKRHPLEGEIEEGLCPGDFISYRMCSEFVEDLEAIHAKLSSLVKQDAAAAVVLYETFIAGSFEKVEELDDSGGDFGQFVTELFCGWIKARQAAGSDADETVAALLSWMDRDPYGFTHDIEKDAAKAFDKKGRAAFVRQIRARFDAAASALKEGERVKDNPEYLHRRWGAALREIHIAQNDLAAYLALAEETGTSAQDCLAIANLFKRRGKLEEALSWTERGLVADKISGTADARADLTDLKFELLAKLGRGDELIEAIWRDYLEHPDHYGYADLMKAVPEDQKKAWHAKAIEAAVAPGTTDLNAVIELLLVAKESEKLAHLLGRTADDVLEGLFYPSAESAAKKLEKAHPLEAARLLRAQGMRIIKAAKSKSYDAAIENFKAAKRCYAKAGMVEEWDRLVVQIRADHFRKRSFMSGFESLVAARKPAIEPSFIERARSRWVKGGQE